MTGVKNVQIDVCEGAKIGTAHKILLKSGVSNRWIIWYWAAEKELFLKNPLIYLNFRTTEGI